MKKRNYIRKAIYLTLLRVDHLLKRSNKIVIFCYHSIAKDNWAFSVKPKNLEKQMDYMLDNYESWSLSDLEKYLKGRKKLTKNVFIVTFDDGYRNLLKSIDLFKSKSIYPTVFLLSDKEKIKRKEISSKKLILKESDILILKSAGWEIGSHSKTHPNFWKLDENKLEEEIKGSKLNLEKNLNLKVNYFAYPKGKYTKNALNIVKKSGYKLALTVDDNFICRSSNKFLLPRIGIDGTHTFEEFKASFTPSVVTFRNIVKHTFFYKFI
ncbi:polysaccharide deacetylase family protein [Candidatus Woesebacteria bacterium]|nr:polysaccharide deacetylase family protein [Candidatus Woesebacteria bacterium]QQG47192.1 MAG: polysaccharide deacetylase family protein [Candidatus Woesebacteria bacterium]